MTKIRILAVGGDSAAAKSLRDRLKGLGYAVSGIASSGEEAVKKASATPVDLVLMEADLRGEIDGIEAAAQIHQRLNIPVVYIGVPADEDTFQRFLETEPYGHVADPLDERELRAAVEIAIRRHRPESKLKERERWLATTLSNIGDAVIVTDSEGYITYLNPVAEALTGWKQEDARAKALSEVFNIVEGETGTAAEAPVPKVLRGDAIVRLTDHILIAGDGAEIPIHDSAAPIKDEEGNIAGVVLTFHDITERKRGDEEIRRRNHELTLLNRAGKAFSSTLDLNEVLSAVLEEVRHLLGAVGCSAWLIDPETNELVCRQVAGPQREIVRNWRLEVGQGIAGQVARAGESLIVPDTRADKRHFKGVDQKTGLAIRSILCVPLHVRRNVIGVIQVVAVQADRFNTGDLRLVEAIASSAASAIENARLYGQNRRQAVEQERHRMARELHDTLMQSLYSIGLAAEASLKLLGRAKLDNKYAAPIEHIQSLSQSTLVEVQEKIHALHPTAVRDRGLIEALAKHCDMLRAQYSLTILIMAGPELPLSAWRRESLFYIAKEALWNVIKHANATRVDIVLARENDYLALSVADDGTGFDTTVFALEDTIGLRNMQERAELLGGSFNLQSTPGQGTRVTARIPVRSSEDDGAPSDRSLSNADEL